MDEKTQKTINDIHRIIQRWKIFWLGQSQPQIETDLRFRHIKQDEHYSSDTYEWILEEFTELILGGEYYQCGMVSASVNALCKQGFISESEYETFWERTFAEIEDMRRLLGLPDPKEGTLEGD